MQLLLFLYRKKTTIIIVGAENNYIYSNIDYYFSIGVLFIQNKPAMTVSDSCDNSVLKALTR